MVWSTRAKRYIDDASGNEAAVCRPAKRRQTEGLRISLADGAQEPLATESSLSPSAVNLTSTLAKGSPTLSRVECDGTLQEASVLHAQLNGTSSVDRQLCTDTPFAEDGKSHSERQVTTGTTALATSPAGEWMPCGGYEARSEATQEHGLGHHKGLRIVSPGEPVIFSTEPLTPRERVYESWGGDEDFEHQLFRAYQRSLHRDCIRSDRYGQEIAEQWKRGSTPEEAREQWRILDAALQRDYEEGTPEWEPGDPVPAHIRPLPDHIIRKWFRSIDIDSIRRKEREEKEALQSRAGT